MKLSDLSITRPVMAVVMSLLLIVLGVMSFTRLTLRELPAIDPPIVSVNVEYTGARRQWWKAASPRYWKTGWPASRAFPPLKRTAAMAPPISASNSCNRAMWKRPPTMCATRSAACPTACPTRRARRNFQGQADADPILWLNMSSSTMDTLQLSDYAERYVVDRFSSLDGVAQVRIGGRQRYAMRIWLDRDQLAARDLTVADVEAALQNENVEVPAGSIESAQRDFTLRVERSYLKPEDFAKLPLNKGEGGYVVRLGDVARVELSSAERRAYFQVTACRMWAWASCVTPPPTRWMWPAKHARAIEVQKSLPQGTNIFVAFDTTTFIDAAVERVYHTLVEAVVLVLVVIWVFLGSARAALIPAVTVPVCLIASFIALYAFDFSINLLTLLALVLCIGLVVDDAIVVVENIQRRIDLGEPPLVAAKRGTGQVAFAVIATTAVLVAVFVPVGFLQGNTGRLFRELAVALAAAVAISAFVALTLTPMMSSKLLRAHGQAKPNRFHQWFDGRMQAVSGAYGRSLERHVHRTWVFALLMLLALGASAWLMGRIPSEVAPAEDRGNFQIMIDGPEGAGFDYTVGQMHQVEDILRPFVGPDKPIVRANPRVPGSFGSSEEMHTGRVSVFLQDWESAPAPLPKWPMRCSRNSMCSAACVHARR